MIYTEIALGTALIVSCVVNSISDCTKGMIYNKVLLWISIFAVLADSIYYGLFVTDLLPEFLLNLAIVSAISLALFYTHSFAGGDCKFAIVCAILYPARFYVIYGRTNLTLIFALCIAIFWGYVYLVISATVSIVAKKNKLTGAYIKAYLLNFLRSFFFATVYITLFMIGAEVFQRNIFPVNVWILRIACIGIAWCVGKSSFLKKWYVMGSACIVLTILCIWQKILPFSTNLEGYVFAFTLMICQMIGKTNLYYEVPVYEIKPGMILSTMSSAIMQGSRVRGLPGLSHEDLRDRLTQEQVDSINRWAKSRQIDTLAMVRKIPFAIFITLGFICYFLIWSVVK